MAWAPWGGGGACHLSAALDPGLLILAELPPPSAGAGRSPSSGAVGPAYGDVQHQASSGAG